MTDFKIRARVGGRYKIQLRNTSGDVTQELDWFDNLVTNQGLDYIGTGGNDYFMGFTQNFYVTRCAVGTGSTPPAFTDTTLTSQLYCYPTNGTNGAGTFSTPSYVAGPPAYFTSTTTFTFPLGAVVGNIAEIGVGFLPVGSTGSTPLALFSHALIMSGGSPTTISVTSADQLVVTYEERWYINTTSSPYSVVISGTTYSGTMLSLNQSLSGAFGLNGAITANASGNITRCYGYNGTIGTVTTRPSGTSTDLGAGTIPAYTTGTYTTSMTFNCTTAQGNLSGGISVAAIQTSFQCWQFSLSPAIPKDNTKTMSLTFSISWARYP